MPPTDADESRETRKQREAFVREGMDFMRRVIRAKAGALLDESEVEGLVSLCWENFESAEKRGPIVRPKGLWSDIAWKKTCSAMKEKLARRAQEVSLEQRSSGSSDQAPVEFVSAAPSPEAALERASSSKRLLGILLTALGERCAEVWRLAMQFPDDRSLAAEILGIPTNTFNKRFGRCSEDVVELLEADDGTLHDALREWREGL